MADLSQIAEAQAKADEAAAKIAEAQAKTAEAAAKIAETKAKAKQKVEEAKAKVEKLKAKKIEIERMLKILSAPKGLGFLIISMLKSSLKSTFRAEKAIAFLKIKFEEKCPLPKVLKEIINKKNKINNAVTQLQKIIEVFNKGTQSLNTFLITLDAIITGINILISTVGSIPPPATAPSGPLIKAQEVADKYGDKVKDNKKIISQGAQGLMVISFALTTITTLLMEIEALISLCLIEALENGDIGEEEMNELLVELNTQSTDSSNPEEDKLKGEALLARLQPNSNNPFIYKDFRFEIQQNPNNPLETIPQRRAVGIQNETNILTVATDYSFASSTEVLINEAKFLVDKWILSRTPIQSNIEIPEEEPILILEEEPIMDIEAVIIPPPSSTPSPDVYYTTVKGDKVEMILKKFGIPTTEAGMSHLQSLNPGVSIKIILQGMPPITYFTKNQYLKVKSISPPPLPPPPPSPLYYISRQAQDLGEISKRTGVNVGTIQNLNKYNLVVGKFYKNPRKAKKLKPIKGSRIRYQ